MNDHMQFCKYLWTISCAGCFKSYRKELRSSRDNCLLWKLSLWPGSLELGQAIQFQWLLSPFASSHSPLVPHQHTSAPASPASQQPLKPRVTVSLVVGCKLGHSRDRARHQGEPCRQMVFLRKLVLFLQFWNLTVNLPGRPRVQFGLKTISGNPWCCVYPPGPNRKTEPPRK